VPSAPPEKLPTLTTPRLILRAFEPADAAEVTRLAGDFAVADTTLNVPHPYEHGDAEAWIATHRPGFAAGELANFAILRRDDRQLLGAIGLQIERRFARANLGYWIGKPYWNQGYCTEAASAVVRYAFVDLSLNRVFASYLTRNPASGRVMQKLGMQREATLREHALKWDRHEDLVVCGLLRREWRDRTTSDEA
jgi:RimJ/RimL family protein N-acetyltransferase